MYGYNLANKKIPKRMGVKASYNLGYGFSGLRSHAQSLNNGLLFGLNSLALLINFMPLL
jgi:hypothetical protein